MKDDKEIQQMIEGVATRIASRKPERAAELRKIAQFLGDPNQGEGMIREFNPEGASQNPGVPFSPEALAGDYSMPVGQPRGGHPDIEPFVNMKVDTQPQVDDRAIHTLTLTLRAPREISEAEMMNYMLGMGEELGVDIDGFKWQKSEPKTSKPV